MTIIANDVLSWVTLALVDPFVDSTLAAGVPAGTAAVSVSFPISQLYLGAQLIVDQGPLQEVVTVTAISAPTFTATYANSHPAGAPLFGATFPAGEPDMPLYTQAEMLDYLADSQKDFILRTRTLFSVSNFTLNAAQQLYSAPETSVRIERVSSAAVDLINSSLIELDSFQPASEAAPLGTPTHWFQDNSGNATVGVWPIPKAAAAAEFWFYDRGPDTLQLNSALLVPAACAHFLKYRVLAKAFEKEGEQRDAERAQFCWRRYKIGLLMTVQHSLGLAAFLREQRGDMDTFVLRDRVRGQPAAATHAQP